MQGFYPCCGVTLVAKDFFQEELYSDHWKFWDQIEPGDGSDCDKVSTSDSFQVVHHILGILNVKR